MKKYPTFLVLVLYCQSILSQITTTIRLDPDNARGGQASQIFDSLRFIPLETTKESLFGAIDQLEVTSQYFIILDMQSRSVLVFNNDGKLHARFTTPSSEKHFGYFTLNRKSNEIIINNNYAGGLLVYNYDGKLLRTESLAGRIQSLYLLNNTFVFNLRRSFNTVPNSKTAYDLEFVNKLDSTKKYAHPYNPTVEDGEYNIDCNLFNFSGEPGSCMFTLPFYYKSFQLTDTGVIHQYNFLFPMEYSLPANFATDSAFKDKRAQYVYTDQENRKKIYSVERVFKSGDYLVFNAPSGQMTLGDNWNYAYNLKSGSLISFAHVTGDSTSCYFPFASSPFENIETVSGKKIYASVPAFRLLAIKNAIDKKVNYPPALKEFINTATKNNNVVIIEAQLKSGL